MLKSTTLAILIVMTATPAMARDFTFKYSAEDLNSSRGIEKTFARLEAKVEAYCTSPGRRSLSAKIAEKTCMDKAMAIAVKEIDHPRLSKIYAAKSGDRSFESASNQY